MAADSWVYDGATWRNIATWWAYDGATWRDIQEAWSYDGAIWRKVFEAVSCATASIDAGQSSWFDTGCTDANECNICVGINHTDCTDPCHNIDTRLSINSGSFNLVFACSNDSCTNQTSTVCNREYDCNLNAGGTKCYSNANTHKPRVEIQRDSDSGIDDTWTYSSTYSGLCLA
jgi:hypothetical protein